MLTKDDFQEIVTSALEELDPTDVRSLRDWLAQLARNVRDQAHDMLPGFDDEHEGIDDLDADVSEWWNGGL